MERVCEVLGDGFMVEVDVWGGVLLFGGGNPMVGRWHWSEYFFNTIVRYITIIIGVLPRNEFAMSTFFQKRGSLVPHFQEFKGYVSLNYSVGTRKKLSAPSTTLPISPST